MLAFSPLGSFTHEICFVPILRLYASIICFLIVLFFYSGLRSLNANNAMSGDVKALSVRSRLCFPFGNILWRGCGKNEMILRYIFRWLPNLDLKTKQNTTVGSNKLFNILVLRCFCRYWLCISILTQNLNAVWGSDHVCHIAVDFSKHSHRIIQHFHFICNTSLCL